MAQPSPNDDIEIVNAPAHFVGDAYHQLLQAPWWGVLLALAALFGATNLVFAFAYLWVGGIANVRPGSFADAFFFSVQTLGTIGYGTMYPVSRAANILMTVESFFAVLVTALSTGLVFAKFSMPQARIAFSRLATVYTLDGARTLALRLGNQRGNYLVEAQIRVTLVRKETSPEGLSNYRMYDLALSRDRSPALGRSWTALHRIGEGSPLHGETVASLTAKETEILVSVVGIDGTTAQTIHARHRYDCEKDLLFGARHADLLSPLPGGRLQLDYAKFHDTVVASLD
jgi:inward rectifier potassium channel